ncbi:cytochrome c oxidase subunit 3 [Natronospira proteinivora]|uniref:cytochrome-c oxidase n=1 Tax=Natronospira proteinivora TaxID=1807133 RepID=A0ABT1G9F1_9GAMM|nr:cytochrome c oxidase subunit 3 [Natronospira proteinivora]MCP1727949.1 cytochrome c oxidase subunit 3 [Natronospira proteinivora]
MAQEKGSYYVPHESHWPVVGTIGMFVAVLGVAALLNGIQWGTPVMFVGGLIIIYMVWGWFRDVINESVSGVYGPQEERSFRQGMAWFILSEVFFFAAFFGALFYARIYSVPWLGGEGANFFTNLLLWEGFEASWPTDGPAPRHDEFGTMGAWGLPAINTAILLTSGVTLTIAHHAIKENNRKVLNWGLFATIALGLIFLSVQMYEYVHAYVDLNLRLDSGIYGSTFFMLTGFHGLHVILGALMLLVVYFRCLKGHFTAENHFAFEAAAWYWHFVDVVWLLLFVFVYWL